MGVTMWLLSLCVTNQALKDAYVDLSQNKVVLDQTINIPMDERYSLMLLFRPVEQHDPSVFYRSFFSYFCGDPSQRVEPWKNPSKKLVFAVEIMTPDGRLVNHKLFEPMCDRDIRNPNNVDLGYVEMNHGKYRIVINNQYPVSIERAGKVQVILRGRGAGYP